MTRNLKSLVNLPVNSLTCQLVYSFRQRVVDIIVFRFCRYALPHSLAHSFAHKHRFHRSRSPLRSLFNLCFWTICCTNSYQLILNTYLDGAKLRKTFCNAWHLLGLSQLLLSTLFNEMCGKSLLNSVLPQIVPLYHMLCNIKARNLHSVLAARLRTECN